MCRICSPRWRCASVCSVGSSGEHLELRQSKTTARSIECKHSIVPFDDTPDISDRGIHAVDPCKPELTLKQPRVVIVGAGVAGLSAAQRLRHYGFDNFVILEATQRPGGRIHTKLLGDMPVELGAGYKTSSFVDNPVYKMSTWKEADPHSFGIFDRVDYGKASSPVVISAYYKFRQIEKEAESLFCHGGSKQHGALFNFIGARIQQDLHGYPEEYQRDAARVMFGLAHSAHSRFRMDHGWIAEDHTGVYLNMPGSNARVPLGLLGNLAPLMKDLVDGHIQYCRAVNCIYWGTCPGCRDRAVVSCRDGDDFGADYVIFTASIGVLSKCQNLFCPKLPALKANAIEHLGMEHCNKIYLKFKRHFGFWLRSCCTKLHFSCYECCCRNDWTMGIVAVELVPHSTHILCAWVIGEGAQQMEFLSEREIVDGVTRVISPYIGSDIPYPSSVLKSNWSGDQYFFGACAGSVNVCPSREACHQAMAVPLPEPGSVVPPIILFAGEATAPGLAGTVAGARISGIREAERIMHLTYRFQGRPKQGFGETLKRRTAMTCT